MARWSLVLVAGLTVASCVEPKPGFEASADTSLPTALASSSSAVATATTMPAPTGEPFVIGVVNSEGNPGVDFPDFSIAFRAAAEYINSELGGFGGRPLELVVCATQASPESSQACAQDLAARGVDMAMIGLDLFVAYGTFESAGIPVIGAVPVFAGDYSANAVYITAGNLVVQAATANAIVSEKYLGLKRVAVIAADSAATADALTYLEPALRAGGAEFAIIKGGETESDAGYRSLMQQAAAFDPTAIIVFYSQAGCVGLMRARADLGIDVPSFASTACLGDSVIDAVGDAAVGWYFAGASGGPESDDSRTMRKYVAEVTGNRPEQIDRYGFTSLGWDQLLTIWKVAANLDAPIGGEAINDAFRSGRGRFWASDAPLKCGSVPALPSVCLFEIPFAFYTANGIEPAFGGAQVSALDVLEF
ncbi:MAG: hypothetical protein FGM29_00505 [Actinobacteria bacterium]|nr:hypothetical protein [Actinomycetota bacterium]